VWHQVNTVRSVKIIPRGSTRPRSPSAPQALNSELLVKVSAVELHAHTVVPPSHLTHSRPREAEAGASEHRDWRIAGKTNPLETWCLAQGVVCPNRPCAD
jgi:hypothetical protein